MKNIKKVFSESDEHGANICRNIDAIVAECDEIRTELCNLNNNEGATLANHPCEFASCGAPPSPSLRCNGHTSYDKAGASDRARRLPSMTGAWGPTAF